MNFKYVLSAFLAMIMLMPALQAEAASKQELNATVNEALDRLYQERPAARELGEKAKGILVFPSVVKGGLGTFGGAIGEGALVVDDNVIDYYRTISASFWLSGSN